MVFWPMRVAVVHIICIMTYFRILTVFRRNPADLAGLDKVLVGESLD